MLRALISSRRRAAVFVLTITLFGSLLAAGTAVAGGRNGTCKRNCTTIDTTPPAISITTPAPGSTLSGSVTVSGTSSDNVAVSAVAVSVDGGSYAGASGTTPWSVQINTISYPNGTHTISARATDTSGNIKIVSESVNVSNVPAPPPSPTPSPSASPTPSPTLSTSPTPSPSPTPTSSTAPGCQVDPFGVTICINTSASWTFVQVESMLEANARDLGKIGPSVTINVEDSSPSTATTSTVCCKSGRYYNFTGTINLEGNVGTFAAFPDAVLAHEWGHIWTLYNLYISQNGNWSAFLNERWTAAGGTTLLANDPRLDSQYMWTRLEIIADDYRLLFGSPSAVSEEPTHLNTQIPDPRDQAGLANWMLTYWAVAH